MGDVDIARLPKNLSYSQVNTYQRCPMCWAERYTGEKSDTAAIGNVQAMYFGHTVGRVLEALAKGEEDWERIYAKSYGHFNDLLHKLGQGGLGVRFERGIKLIEHYVEGGVLRGNAEAQFSLDLPGLPPILGRMDVEGLDFIGEFKTSAAKWDQERVDTELQGTLYYEAFRLRNGRRPDCIVYVVFSTIGAIKVTRYRTTRSEDQINDAILIVRQVYEGMVSGVYEGKCPIHKPPGTRSARVKDKPPVLIVGEEISFEQDQQDSV